MQMWHAGECRALGGGCEEEWGLQRAGHVSKDMGYNDVRCFRVCSTQGKSGGQGIRLSCGKCWLCHLLT